MASVTRARGISRGHSHSRALELAGRPGVGSGAVGSLLHPPLPDKLPRAGPVSTG